MSAYKCSQARKNGKMTQQYYLQAGAPFAPISGIAQSEPFAVVE
jgi:hypothetical protein